MLVLGPEITEGLLLRGAQMLHARPIGAHVVDREVNNSHMCVCKSMYAMLRIFGGTRQKCINASPVSYWPPLAHTLFAQQEGV